MPDMTWTDPVSAGIALAFATRLYGHLPNDVTSPTGRRLFCDEYDVVVSDQDMEE